MLCFRKLLVAKKFEEKKLGLVSKFYGESFLSQSAEKHRRGTRNPSVLCFRDFLVAKNFMDKKGGVSHFSVENFLSHSTETFRTGTPLCSVSENYS